MLKKSIVFGGLTLGLFLVHTSFAAITFVPASPQNITVLTTPTCSIGDTDDIYNNGVLFDSETCDGTSSFTSPVPLTYIVAECDSTILGASCGQTLLTDERTQPGYIGEELYTFAPLDFSGLNFIETCQTDSSGSPTIRQCYNSATALNETLLVTVSLIVSTLCIAKIFAKK